MKTPTTRDGLTQYDHLPWEEAARRAWQNPGDHPAYHAAAMKAAAEAMPLLARALNRAAKEQQ